MDEEKVFSGENEEPLEAENTPEEREKTTLDNEEKTAESSAESSTNSTENKQFVDENREKDKKYTYFGQENFVPHPNVIKEYFEKPAVKRTANKIGLCLILFNFITLVLQVAISLVLSFLGKAEYLSDPFVVLELNIILTILGFVPIGAIIFGVEKGKKALSFGFPKKQSFVSLILMGVGFFYTANVLTVILQSNLSFLGELKGGDITLPTGVSGVIMSVLAVAAAPALLEEFVFRGAILGGLLKYGKGFAIFTSALLFGLMHGNLVQIPFAFMAGLIIGFVVVETGSFWSGVLIHFINNLMSVGLDILKNYLGETAANGVYMFLLVILISIGIIGFFAYSLKNKNAFTFEKTEHFSSTSERIKWFISAGAIVIYIIIVALEVIILQLAPN